MKRFMNKKQKEPTTMRTLGSFSSIANSSGNSVSPICDDHDTSSGSSNKNNSSKVFSKLMNLKLRNKSNTKKNSSEFVDSTWLVEDVNTDMGGDNPLEVKCKVIFVRMGTINTILERFDCHAFVECYWEDDKLFEFLLGEVNTRRFQGVSSAHERIGVYLKTFDFEASNKYWTPQLYLDNAIGEMKFERTYKLEIVEKRIGSGKYTIRVYEQVFVKGIFYERLELFDFPCDCQELTITITSHLPASQVKIIENPCDPSTISTDVFLNQQEWHLYTFVECAEKKIFDTFKGYYRPGFGVSSFIARKPGYYINNAYTLIFLITVLGFVPFSVDVAKPNARMQVAGVLILTQVNFRWIIIQRIPSVPYLTSIDKFAIGNLFFLVAFAVWHAIIGSNLFDDDYAAFREPVDMYALIAFSIAFILYTLFYVIQISVMQHRAKQKEHVRKPFY